MRMKFLRIPTLVVAVNLCFGAAAAAATDEVIRHPSFPKTKLNEDERRAEYDRRNYTWPIEKFVPDTAGWNNLMKQRMGQVDELEGLVSDAVMTYQVVLGCARFSTFFGSSPSSLTHYNSSLHRDPVTKDTCNFYDRAFCHPISQNTALAWHVVQTTYSTPCNKESVTGCQQPSTRVRWRPLMERIAANSFIDLI